MLLLDGSSVNISKLEIDSFAAITRSITQQISSYRVTISYENLPNLSQTDSENLIFLIPLPTDTDCSQNDSLPEVYTHRVLNIEQTPKDKENVDANLLVNMKMDYGHLFDELHQAFPRKLPSKIRSKLGDHRSNSGQSPNNNTDSSPSDSSPVTIQPTEIPSVSTNMYYCATINTFKSKLMENIDQMKDKSESQIWRVLQSHRGTIESYLDTYDSNWKSIDLSSSSSSLSSSSVRTEEGSELEESTNSTTSSYDITNSSEDQTILNSSNNNTLPSCQFSFLCGAISMRDARIRLEKDQLIDTKAQSNSSNNNNNNNMTVESKFTFNIAFKFPVVRLKKEKSLSDCKVFVPKVFVYKNNTKLGNVQVNQFTSNTSSKTCGTSVDEEVRYLMRKYYKTSLTDSPNIRSRAVSPSLASLASLAKDYSNLDHQMERLYSSNTFQIPQNLLYLHKLPLKLMEILELRRLQYVTANTVEAEFLPLSKTNRMYFEAMRAFKKRKFDKAAKGLNKVLQRNSKHIPSLIHTCILQSLPTPSNNNIQPKPGYDKQRHHVEAEAYKTHCVHLQTILANPFNSTSLANYALFLESVMQDLRRAERYFTYALIACPSDANALCNYAVFLKNVHLDYDTAEEMYQRAIRSNPFHINSLGNYATFLYKVRKDTHAAEAYFQQLLYLQRYLGDRSSLFWLQRYSTFLEEHGNLLKAAECQHVIEELKYGRLTQKRSTSNPDKLIERFSTPIIRKSDTSADNSPSTEKKLSEEEKKLLEHLVEKLLAASDSTHAIEMLNDDEVHRFADILKFQEGRLKFLKLLNDWRGPKQRILNREVFTLLKILVQITLEESERCDDFLSVKLVMHMGATYYLVQTQPTAVENAQSLRKGSKESLQFLNDTLKDASVWKNMRYWEEAVYDEISSERRRGLIESDHRTVRAGSEGQTANNNKDKRLAGKWKEMSKDEIEDLENEERCIAFGQLATFSWNMITLGVPSETTIDFIRKQSTIHHLTEDQTDMLLSSLLNNQSS